jgi:hypothetical protein
MATIGNHSACLVLYILGVRGSQSLRHALYALHRVTRSQAGRVVARTMGTRALVVALGAAGCLPLVASLTVLTSVRDRVVAGGQVHVDDLPATFGPELTDPIEGDVVWAWPADACEPVACIGSQISDLKTSVDRSAVVNVTTDNYDETLQAREYMMLLFYGAPCGDCEKHKREFELAAQNLRGDGVNVTMAMIDAEANRDIADQHHMHDDYPKLKWFAHGGASTYEYSTENRRWDLRAESITNWIEQYTGAGAQMLASKDACAAHVVMVRRGNCHFSQKIVNAQAVGASAVVVYGSRRSEQLVSMSADGDRDAARGIQIPSVYVTKRSSHIIAQLAGARVRLHPTQRLSRAEKAEARACASKSGCGKICVWPGDFCRCESKEFDCSTLKNGSIAPVAVYGADWCGHTQQQRNELSMAGIPYTYHSCNGHDQCLVPPGMAASKYASFGDQKRPLQGYPLVKIIDANGVCPSNAVTDSEERRAVSQGWKFERGCYLLRNGFNAPEKVRDAILNLDTLTSAERDSSCDCAMSHKDSHSESTGGAPSAKSITMNQKSRQAGSKQAAKDCQHTNCPKGSTCVNIFGSALCNPALAPPGADPKRHVPAPGSPSSASSGINILALAVSCGAWCAIAMRRIWLRKGAGWVQQQDCYELRQYRCFGYSLGTLAHAVCHAISFTWRTWTGGVRYRLDVAYTDFAATVAAENAEMKQREELKQREEMKQLNSKESVV